MQPSLIGSWDYPAEEHLVTTEDGYILRLHRIPSGRRPGQQQQQKEGEWKRKGGKVMPVLIGHCLFCSSAVFAFGPPDR